MPKFLVRFLSIVCMAVVNVSCVFEYPPEWPDDDGVLSDKDKVVLKIDVQPIAASASTNPAERIKTVRVVIISKAEGNQGGDIVECNRLLDMPDMAALGYSRTLMWESTGTEKDIFVIANEESVGPNLSTLVASYAEGKEAGDFISQLEGYYFSPEYNAKDGKIYLPYTFSRKGLTPQAGVVNDIKAWLIPTAVKFVFNFTNSREDAINVNGISMSKANEANYLLARPGPGELIKQYNGESMSWIDWLAEISRNSWNYPDFSGNEGFNDQVGWIADYELPNPADSHIYTFIAENSEDAFTVSGATTTEENGEKVVTPGKHTTRVYYLPESANFITEEDGGNGSDPGEGDNTIKVQRFFLTLLLEDTGPTQAPPFNEVAIPNLGALFRNTYVIIDVNMAEGDIEVYAEIAPWTEKTANGWVEDGDAPANNPFKIKTPFKKKW